MSINTYTGVIHFRGESTSDEHLRQIRKIEIQTESGLVELPNVCVPLEVDRGLEVGTLASISASSLKDKNGHPSTMVWAAHDHRAKRTFFNQEMLRMRSYSQRSTVFWAVVGLPLGVLMFVVPVFFVLWHLIKMWSRAQSLPTEEEMRESVASLAQIVPPASLSAEGDA